MEGKADRAMDREKGYRVHGMKVGMLNRASFRSKRAFQ